MKKIVLFVAAALGLHQTVTAQYYYRDIHNTQQTEANLALLKQNKITSQLVQSLEPNGETDNDFKCQRYISSNYRQMRSVTQSQATGYSVMTSYFSVKGKLTKTVDSTKNSITSTLYLYDRKTGLISDIQIIARAREGKYRLSETRTYVHDTLGHLTKMIHTRGEYRTDTSIVLFTTNELGHVTEEMETGRGMHSQRIFYRYNSDSLLTDIVRYSPSRKKLLPDYMFEYDEQKRLVQMVTVNIETAVYTIWKYNYNKQGLPEKENCYGRDNELLGMIKYKYLK